MIFGGQFFLVKLVAVLFYYLKVFLISIGGFNKKEFKLGKTRRFLGINIEMKVVKWMKLDKISKTH